MSELVVSAAEDEEEEQQIEVVIGTDDSNWSLDDLGKDVFKEKYEVVKTLGGISPALKRKKTRELNKRLVGADGVESKQITLPVMVGSAYSYFEVAIPPYNLDYLAQIYEVSAPHYAAINVKTANIVGLGYDWVESTKTQDALDKISGDEDKIKKFRRKLQKYKVSLNEWIDSTNQDTTFTETLMNVWTDLEATGNGYLEVGRTTDGAIKYIGHIPSVSLRVRLKRDGFVQIIGKEAVYFRNFGDRETQNPIGNDPRPNELIHLKKYSPTNSYYGVPDIMAAKNALAGNEYAARYNLDYFEHKAVPRYVIVVKGTKLSPAAEQRVIDFFRGGLRGKNHRTLYIPLPKDSEKNGETSFEMNPVETGIQDSSFSEFRKENRDDILMAHGVPLSKVAMPEGVSLAIARDADKTFKEQKCRPAQDIFEKKLNQIIVEVTDALTLKLNELTLTDEETQAKIDQIYLTNQTDTPNEIRARRGKSGIPGGDKVVQLKAQPAAEQRAQAGQTRARDKARAINAPDRSGNARAPKGEGRQQP